MTAALLLAGCGDDPKLTAGEVIAKEYDDPDHWTIFVPCGKSICPIPQYDTAHWRIRIAGQVDGEPVEEWHDVDEATYRELDVGDVWSVGR